MICKIDTKSTIILDKDLSISDFLVLSICESMSVDITLKNVIAEMVNFKLKSDSIYRILKRLSNKGLIDFKYKKIAKPTNLYLFSDTEKTILKIGISSNCKHRLQYIQNKTSKKLELIFEKKSLSYMEKELHSKFSHLNIFGEWFHYSQDIINHFNNL